MTGEHDPAQYLDEPLPRELERELERGMVRELITQGESRTLEFKRTLTKNLGRALCAFANSDGGTLLIGLSNRGRIVGVADHSRAESRIQSIARVAEPPIAVKIEAIDKVFRVTVPPQPDKPYSYGGRFFRRDGATNRRMSRAEIKDLFHATGRLHFDRTACPQFNIESHLDDAVWAVFSQRAKVPEAMDRIAALRNLGLVDARQRITHAGAWLMARDIRTVTTSAHVSCALFLGRTNSRILDQRDFHGDVPSMIEDAVAWILTKINVALIVKGVRRVERLELPEEALREAVANAVAHRDYRSPDNVQVYVFKDRVEIVSPGGLPEGMTRADLGAKSLPRNPLLFSMLHRMGVAEDIGSGIRRILNGCQDHGVPEPVIDVSGQWVKVTFPRPDQYVREQECGPEHRPETKPESETARASRDKWPETIDSGPQAEAGDKPDRARTRSRAGSLDRRVLALLVNGPLAKSAIARRLGHRSVSGGLNRVVRRLRRDGLVEYTLPEKPNSSRQEYRLTPTGHLALEDQAGP
ncbi:MAG: hypothetical protein F4139_16065 [Gemmatimonadetes bacterium]|nr:hypothetical protein [Gemmatimonadota bacterium]MYA64469.1 hypothetical protein [Gemmatimonadota bacterium]MYB98994.1 hypothetical protein [Gemmatimonadota bacterium]MYH54431.1 hypothetical protein [Gemmatimonadota bacterium]MYI44787.1 hypothetical protein [Gemmatimonadota bacterium]